MSDDKPKRRLFRVSCVWQNTSWMVVVAEDEDDARDAAIELGIASLEGPTIYVDGSFDVDDVTEITEEEDR